MTRKELDFNKLSSLKPKKAESPIDSDKAVNTIHHKETEKEKVKRVTIDLPFLLYADIRRKLIDNKQTLKDYFMTLAKKDLRQIGSSKKNQNVVPMLYPGS